MTHNLRPCDVECLSADLCSEEEACDGEGSQEKGGAQAGNAQEVNIVLEACSSPRRPTSRHSTGKPGRQRPAGMSHRGTLQKVPWSERAVDTPSALLHARAGDDGQWQRGVCSPFFSGVGALRERRPKLAGSAAPPVPGLVVGCLGQPPLRSAGQLGWRVGWRGQPGSQPGANPGTR